MDVWCTYVVFYIFQKNTAVCKYMYEGPAVAFKPQGPEGPRSGHACCASEADTSWQSAFNKSTACWNGTELSALIRPVSPNIFSTKATDESTGWRRTCCACSPLRFLLVCSELPSSNDFHHQGQRTIYISNRINIYSESVVLLKMHT